MNYWVMALYFQWITPELVKQAVELDDCSMEDLNAGYEQRILTLEQLQEIEPNFKARE
ncbi:XkdX family protein [Bacillus sp. FSL L8-0215]|uniref:XkdX family protein n=1 Tax=Bacillus safensis TaxID=561879 RepID=A0A5S9MFL3_BACIA|nr:MULTISPECIES: XkdX family protein [Bacillus]MBK4212880.1 XkdX family protein [Bacillus pumilus]MCY7467826.1 XkdX family protein [Bacillus safensis]MED0802445.1 XkdX family protein [Bacillus safensis]NWF42216.1 XkdX family protein [Bacillus sp. 8A6]USY28357.1 XkdX family protein [Bacillus safensis]